MNKLTQIKPDMFPELYRSLLREHNSAMPESYWARVFAHSRPHDEDHPLGYALTDGGRIVGMLGTIFSERTIQGQPSLFCNLHCWLVKPEYRVRSLQLMRPVLDRKDCTITDFSPTRNVVAISKKLGLQYLDDLALLMYPLPCRRNTGCTITDLDVAEGPPTELSDADARIYRDHCDIGCGHVMVRDKDAYCYIVYSRIENRWLPHCYVHYMSDPQLFARHHKAIRAHLIQRTRTRGVIVDMHLLAGIKIPRALQLPANEKLYRSKSVRPELIDNLYSDMAYLKLSTLPPLRMCVATAIRRKISRLVRPAAVAQSAN